MEARIERPTGGTAWIVGDDDEVIVIDPGDDPGGVLAAVGDRDILAVICTHGHPGHIGAAIEVAERDEAPVALHPADLLADGPAPHEGDYPDFPGQLTAIGERLLDLPPRTRVLPGHGEESTISAAAKRFDGWVTAGPAAGLG
jgi:glyoxylase-like metal-dependent hydrolase (beta-lactamase superfamily II)